MQRSTRAWLLACAAALVPVSATAQDTAETDGEEVVVTGLRRQTTVQNTGAVIEVLSSKKLEAGGVSGSMSAQFAVPGVLISQDLALQTQVYIRGIGSNLQGIAISNSVATYLDGVYLPNVIQAAQSFNDIERVEVLKGPQATLYGRNATGGAINIISKEPSLDFSAAADVSIGNHEAYSARASVNGTILEGKIAGRIAIQHSQHAGYATNLFNGREILGDMLYGIRGALKFFVSENVDIVVRADYVHEKTGDLYKLLPSTSVYYIGALQYFTPDPRAVYYDIHPSQPVEDMGGSFTLNWRMPFGKLTSVTGARRFEAGPIFSDSDQIPIKGTFFPAGAGALGSKVGSDAIYHETYLATDAEKTVSAVVGFNVFHEDAFEFARTQGPTVAVPLTATDRYSTTDAWSVYIDGTWRVTDKINVIAGVRYSEETRDYRFYRRTPAGTTEKSEATFVSTSPRFAIEYRPNDGLLFYASATSGFKSGGFNTAVPSNGFGPEEIWSYEAGVKSTLWDKRARLNMSVFYYDYANIQVLQYLTINSLITPIITNAGTAKLWGSDISADLRVTDELTIGAGVSLLHTEFGSAIFCDPLFGSCTATNPAARPMVNVEGNRLPRAPEVTGNLYADYVTGLGDGSVTLHADAAYRSKTYYTVFQNPLYAADSFWILGASARYDAPEGWFAEIYGRNLTDELAITQIINSSPLRNPSTGVILGGTPARFERYAPPLTYGLRLGVSF